MVDDDGERLDWGNDDDEPQNGSEQYTGYSPRQSTGGYTGAPEDAEDAISLGGDDEDEREFYANHSSEQAPGTHLTKQSSFASHPGRRDGQRLSATTPSRTPSRAKNSESPSRDSRPPNSASSTGKLPPAPLIHGLPPKPVLVPPLFEQPTEPGILASAMLHNKPRKSNGTVKGVPAPDDWEIRYPRGGGKDTEESTWTRPRLQVTSGRSSPTKIRENGSAQLSGRRSPDVQDSMWTERTGRSQQPRPARRDTAPRRTSRGCGDCCDHRRTAR
ncbi:hypothetical protein OH76DRAFT_1457354 [Lentinus brumalis]|uniref:Uncharacterized protein n=1 Tax=Lentinus brumalis TaxID=2498619 RepID=A0A371D0Y1_9APHY|nr:hypothetical protein OH76DRAFT_1457354 [Polyporus brumalis]